MIQLYRKDNLTKPYAQIAINSGSIRGERNGYYGLSFSVLSSYLKEHSITIDHNTIYKVANLYYAHSAGGSSDSKQILRNIDAELLQTQILMFKFIPTLSLKATTLLTALTSLVSGTIFQVGTCDSIGAFDFELTKVNAQQGLAQLIKQTGTEVKYDGLTISLKLNQSTSSPLELKKGYDFTTLDENTDVSNVITKLHFKNTKGDLSGSVSSANASKYNFIREGYQEFEADTLPILTTKATEYLATVDRPRASATISIPKVKKLSLQLCQTVKVHNTLLDTQLEYKVVGYTKSLTDDNDTYELGERRKDFADIQEIVSQEVQSVAPDIIIEVVEKEVLSAKTAHILNAWIRDLNVEYLETNFDALDVRKPAPYDNVRNCIRIYDEKIDYITQNLSTTLTLDYKNRDGQQIYYTAINTHPQAYKFFTLTAPTSIYPDLTPAQAATFKVRVRKVLSESVKASFKFNDTGGGGLYPAMVWGEGTDSSGLSDEGKGFIFKDLEGLVLRYVTSTGTVHEIKLGENGIEGVPILDPSTIKIPGLPLTNLTFYTNGLLAKFGSLKKRWELVEDANGLLETIVDIDSLELIPVQWLNESISRWT